MHLIILVVILIILFYIYKLNKLYSYWKHEKVIGPTPIPIFGNYFTVFFNLQSEAELLHKIYEKYPNKYIGIYKGIYPVLLVKDPAVIKQILLKDFDSFNARCIEKSLSVFKESIFIMKGEEKWKMWRRILSPGLLSDKIEKMIPIIRSTFNNNLNNIETNKEISVNKIVKKHIFQVFNKLIYNKDVSFGINNNTFEDVINKFVKLNLETSFTAKLEMIVPEFIAKVISQTRQTLDKTNNLLKDIILMLINEVENKGVKQNNLLEVMVGMKINGRTRKDKTINIDNNVIIQQTLTFFLTGLESTSSILAFALYELALNEKIQNNCVEEINSLNEESTLKTLSNLSYIQMVIDETLRIHTFPIIDRKSVKDCDVIDENLVIHKNISIFIPVRELHHDLNHFTNSNVFDPTRFSEINKNKIPNYTYLPFGDGPRMCIGIRLAKIILMISLVEFLSKYKVCLPRNKSNGIKYNTKRLRFLAPSDDVMIVLEKRKK